MAKTHPAASEGLDVQAGPAIANIVCEVLPENTVIHGGEHHAPGDTFEVEGPTAISLVQNGHVKIVGSAA
jgi:hypothetical protein